MQTETASSEYEFFYDFSRQKGKYGVQVMKNGMFVGGIEWVATEDDAKKKIEELKLRHK